MVPQFNLLKGRFEVVGDDHAYASTLVQEGRSWFALVVRGGRTSHYEARRVKGYDLMVWN